MKRTKAALAAAKARGVELGRYGRTVLASRNQSAVKRAKCNAALLHNPLLVMLAALALPILLALPSGALRRPSGVVLLTAYAGYTVLALAG